MKAYAAIGHFKDSENMIRRRLKNGNMHNSEEFFR